MAHERIGFIGLGPIGQAMTKRLVDHGKLQHDLLLYNRTYETAQIHAQRVTHASAVPSLAAVVQQADILWSCLLNDDAVKETYDSIATQPLAGKLLVECSTVAGETIDQVGDKVRQAGGMFLAMPVFGEPSTAAAGKLIVVPAGPAEGIDRIRPLLVGVTASSIVDFPDGRPSQASMLKLVGNVLIMTTMEQVAELLVFAEKAQLGMESVEKLLAALYPGGPQQHSTYASLMVSGEYYRRKPIVGTGAAIALSEKIIGLADSLDVKLKAYKVAIEYLRKARDAAGPNSDITGLYGAVRQASGLEFERKT